LDLRIGVPAFFDVRFEVDLVGVFTGFFAGISPVDRVQDLRPGLLKTEQDDACENNVFG